DAPKILIQSVAWGLPSLPFKAQPCLVSCLQMFAFKALKRCQGGVRFRISLSRPRRRANRRCAKNQHAECSQHFPKHRKRKTRHGGRVANIRLWLVAKPFSIFHALFSIEKNMQSEQGH